MKKSVIILILIIFLSGCNETQEKYNPLKISIDVPSEVFEQEEIYLTATMENNALKSYDNIKISLFNPGEFSVNDCSVLSKNRLTPYEIAVLDCELKAPSVLMERQYDLGLTTEFSSSLNHVLPVELVSQDEYRKMEQTGKTVTENYQKTVSDGNIRMNIELPTHPLIEKQSDQYMKIDLTNSGNGYAEITSFSINSPLVSDCDNTGSFELNGDKTINCLLNTQTENYLSVENVIFNINYDYEIITTKTVSVKK